MEKLGKFDKTEVLRKYFGHSSFRQGQEEIIDNILAGRDCLGVMPTGAGKSMCFQIPAVMLDGTAIVISPLISLMQDQVEALVQSGINAAYLNSSLNLEQYRDTLSRIAKGAYKIVYVAPERLETDGFSNICSKIQIPLVAVDEAHCVSHWGQDFRPSYLKISNFIKALPERPVTAAFTATATDIVREDIVNILELNNPYRIITGFDRSNLYFEVRRPQFKDKDGELLKIIGSSDSGSVIVYCSTRKNVEHVYEFLNSNGYPAARYHAGLPDNERKSAQEDFIYDRVNVIVATNAFGMGIDKSNVSLVIHYNMPKDPESYYQEAGRAGRDGSPARCILIYNKSDVRTAEFMIENSHEETGLSPEDLSKLRTRDYERLKQMTFYSTTSQCLRSFLLNYFGEKSPNYCGNCSNCNSNFETADITVDAQKILSCIYRLAQRKLGGGKALLSSILTGSETNQIIYLGLNTLSTFGIMKDSSISRIRDIIDFLELNGYIEKEFEHKTYKLTPLADDFIKKRKSLFMKLPKNQEQKTVQKTASSNEENPQLMLRLKALRKKQAAVLGVPAYVIFTDASLREMSVKQPLTKEEFMNISGVGSIKAERYYKIFSEVIRKYKNENNIP